jgi:hypothetical protein
MGSTHSNLGTTSFVHESTLSFSQGISLAFSSTEQRKQSLPRCSGTTGGLLSSAGSGIRAPVYQFVYPMADDDLRTSVRIPPDPLLSRRIRHQSATALLTVLNSLPAYNTPLSDIQPHFFLLSGFALRVGFLQFLTKLSLI